MDMIAVIAIEKDEALRQARESGLTAPAFNVYWSLRDDPALTKAGIDRMALAREVDALLARFPTARVNPDETRRLRAELYKPLMDVSREERSLLVERIMMNLTGES
jgi:type I restriction enzyme R subunit